MSRILALDPGEKRIGVAVTDALNITAQGLETIQQKTKEDTLKKLKEIVKEYDVEKVVIGLPLNMDGSKGEKAKLSEEFACFLKKGLSIDVELTDERLTTLQGERILLEADISRRKRKKSIDKISAQLILQNYLSSRGEKFSSCSS